jgi:hypothetical protein
MKAEPDLILVSGDVVKFRTREAHQAYGYGIIIEVMPKHFKECRFTNYRVFFPAKKRVLFIGSYMLWLIN